MFYFLDFQSNCTIKEQPTPMSTIGKKGSNINDCLNTKKKDFCVKVFLLISSTKKKLKIIKNVKKKLLKCNFTNIPG